MLRLAFDDQPDDVLAAMDADQPVAVLDRRRHRSTSTLSAAVQAQPLPAGTWLVALTSGSEQHPRAVCRTRASWQASVDPFAALTATTHATRVLVPGPLSSTLFLYAAWHARQVGARPIIAPPARPAGARPSPLGSDEPWDVVHLVPQQLRGLLDLAESGGPDLGGRTAVVAGAALSPTLHERARRHGLRVVTYYGAAELSFVAAGDGEALRAFPGVQVDLREGEVWALSPYVALDYVPAGGAASPWRRDESGWSTVGDRGRLDDEGRLSIHGRGAAAVQTGGATVHVADVEHVLRSHPGVTDVVVTGIPHDVLGEVVAAAVETSSATVPGLRDWSRTTLPVPARPRRWALVPRLPRTPSGKVDRAAVGPLLSSAVDDG